MALALAACASNRERILLEPGVQLGDAEVDVESGVVTMEREGVGVSVQAAMLPSPRGEALHPTFWVTVRNDREERIVVRPADARLIDTFGNQLAPVPMSVGASGRDVRYALVDPEIHTYVSLHFGWPYYPVYPYHGWFAHPRFSRVRYWHYEPFWTLGIGPVWIREVRPAAAHPAPDAQREEVIYDGARLTYVVVFPEIERTVRGVRLVVPDIRPGAYGAGVALDFELVFEQILIVDGR
jgi:hypothetical protein